MENFIGIVIVVELCFLKQLMGFFCVSTTSEGKGQLLY